MAATIKDIARQTGLGLATISKYINGGNVRPQNKELIDKAIQELDFTVNEFARGLKSNKSRLIGVIIPELSEIFIAQIISVFEDILRMNDYSVIVCDCHSDQKLEHKLVDFLLNKRVDGIICAPVDQSGRHLLRATQKGIPVVVFDRFVQPLMGKVDFVLVDNAEASRQAVECLAKKGHKRIGIIAGPECNYTAAQRLHGYQTAMKLKGLSTEPELCFAGDYTVEGGFACMKHILENREDITAVYATNYFMTLGAIMAMNEYRSLSGRKISFIGFDNIELTRLLKPSPTMISQPMNDIGTNVAQIMLRRLKDERKDRTTSIITLPTSIVKGQSVYVPQNVDKA